MVTKPSEFEDMAPDKTVWWCPQCGRLSADRHGKLAMLGWSDSCTMLAVLVSEDTIVLDPNGRVTQADLISEQPEPFPGRELALETHL